MTPRDLYANFPDAAFSGAFALTQAFVHDWLCKSKLQTCKRALIAPDSAIIKCWLAFSTASFNWAPASVWWCFHAKFLHAAPDHDNTLMWAFANNELSKLKQSGSECRRRIAELVKEHSLGGEDGATHILAYINDSNHAVPSLYALRKVEFWSRSLACTVYLRYTTSKKCLDH